MLHVLMPIAAEVPAILWPEKVQKGPIPELLTYLDVILQRLRTKA